MVERTWVLMCLCFVLAVAGAEDSNGNVLERRPILQNSIVDRVNAHNGATWKAGFNDHFVGYTVKDFKKLCGSITTPIAELDPSIPIVNRRSFHRTIAPRSFDARKAWSSCPSISNILDQGHCGSCWAFGAVEALSDRFCIHGLQNVSLSENDLLACCGFECGFGCEGGYPYKAWQYFKRSGVVTSQCNPYFDTIGCGHPGCQPELPTPTCSKNCVNDELWSESKHFSLSVYRFSPDVNTLMEDLYLNGPIEVSFNVYEDFAHYKSGVYQYLYGDYMGGHAVKLIGWGTTDEGIDYWLVANSWNTDWGENGYFRIVRGINEVGIEGSGVAGLPLVRKKATFPVADM